MAFMQDFENIISLVQTVNSGAHDRLNDELATLVGSLGAKNLAEAQDVMGKEMFSQYVARPRAAIRNQRDEQRIAHEKRMQDLEYERARLQNLKLAQELEGLDKPKDE